MTIEVAGVEEKLKKTAATPPRVAELRRGSAIIGAIKILRPKQWTKNGLLFAALIFSGRFLTPRDVGLSFLGVAAFCLLSSSGYVLNDYLDRHADRKHPRKCLRPIASGALPERMALLWMACVLFGGVFAAYRVSPGFLLVSLGYLVITVSYSLYFKHKVILDVMFLAACYVLRAIAGAVAIDVRVSPWLFLCTAFLALFLGFNKRRAELVNIGGQVGTRKNLRDYSPEMLVQFQAIVTACTILCYALYTVLGHAAWMTLTIPFVLYGIFRYIYLVDQKGEGGAPDETLLRDKPILVTVGLYVVTAAAVMYAQMMGVIS